MPENNSAKIMFDTDLVGKRRRGGCGPGERDLADIGRDRGWRLAAIKRLLLIMCFPNYDVVFMETYIVLLK